LSRGSVLPALWIFLTALAVRLVHVWQMRASPFFAVLLGDSRGYDEWARRIAGGEWIGTDVFYQAPLYPYMLGVIYAVAGHHLLLVRIVQAVIGAASCALLALAAERLLTGRGDQAQRPSEVVDGRRAGIAAGMMLALYAPAIFFDALIQKSVLDVFFLCVGLYLIAEITVRDRRDRRLWFALGVAIGALALTRENALVFIVVIIAWALVYRERTAASDKTPVTASRKAPITAGHKTLTTAGHKARIAANHKTPITTNHKTPITTSHKTPITASRKALITAGHKTPITTNPQSPIPNPLAWRATRAATFVAGLALLLVPVAARNAYVGGGFYITTSQAGPNFYIGNNPKADGTYQSLRFGRGAPEYERQDATELAERALGRPLTPSEVSSYWIDKAMDFITSQPAAWLRLMARKAALLWNAREMLDTEGQEAHAEYSWPLRILGVVGHFGLLVPLALIGVIVTWPLRRRLAIGFALTLVYAASVVAFYVFARYRYPLVPLLMLFAGAGVIGARAWAITGRRDHVAFAAAAVAVTAVFCNWPLLSTTLMRAVSESNLAVGLQSDGRIDEALRHYERAIALRPDYAPAYSNLGTALRAKGRRADAVAAYERAISLRADYPEAHYNLANVLTDEGRTKEAAQHFRVALQAMPGSADVHNNLGIALADEGKRDDAITEFRAAVAADPASPKSHRNLADALAGVGRNDEALIEFRRAAQLAPADGAIRYDLGSFLMEIDRTEEAIVEFRAALKLSPRSVQAHNNLGIALATQGRMDEAISHFRAALAIDPNFPDAKRNLQTALASRRR
jgi:tetratricopeptide (TPR) repeat protein